MEVFNLDELLVKNNRMVLLAPVIIALFLVSAPCSYPAHGSEGMGNILKTGELAEVNLVRNDSEAVVYRAGSPHPPVCVITWPSNGDVLSGMVNIQGKASDPAGNATLLTVEVRFDSGIWNPAAGTSSWLFSWNTQMLSDGSHAICARALDMNGSFSEIAEVFIVVNNGALFGWFSGTVTSDNASGIAGAIVRVNGTGNYGITNSSGRYNITVQEGGPYELQASASDHVIGYNKGKQVFNNMTTTADFVLIYDGLNIIKCTITYPSSSQEVNGTVSISGTAWDRKSKLMRVEVEVDALGWAFASGTSGWSYSWNTSNVVNGGHQVRARAFDSTDYSLESLAWVIVNNTIPPPVLTGWIAGNVKSNYNNKPVANADITVDGKSEKTVTDASGYYIIELPVGTYNISVSAQFYYMFHQTSVVVIKGATTIFDCTLIAHKGDVTGRVTEIDTGSGIWNANVTIQGWPIPASTDTDGYYTMTGVRAGTYDIVIFASGYQNKTVKNITVVKDATITVNVSLSPICVLTGIVRDNSTREALVGVIVWVGDQMNITDKAGQYYFNVPSGIWNISASMQGYKKFFAYIPVQKGNNRLDIDLEPTKSTESEGLNLSWIFIALLIVFIIVFLIVIIVIIIRKRKIQKDDNLKLSLNEVKGKESGKKSDEDKGELGKGDKKKKIKDEDVIEREGKSKTKDDKRSSDETSQKKEKTDEKILEKYKIEKSRDEEKKNEINSNDKKVTEKSIMDLASRWGRKKKSTSQEDAIKEAVTEKKPMEKEVTNVVLESRSDEIVPESISTKTEEDNKDKRSSTGADISEEPQLKQSQQVQYVDIREQKRLEKEKKKQEKARLKQEKRERKEYAKWQKQNEKHQMKDIHQDQEPTQENTVEIANLDTGLAEEGLANEHPETTETYSEGGIQQAENAEYNPEIYETEYVQTEYTAESSEVDKTDYAETTQEPETDSGSSKEEYPPSYETESPETIIESDVDVSEEHRPREDNKEKSEIKGEKTEEREEEGEDEQKMENDKEE